jgi:hypothetical protein
MTYRKEAFGGMRIDGETKVLEEYLPPSSTLPITDPTYNNLGLNPNCHDRKVATSCLGYGIA